MENLKSLLKSYSSSRYSWCTLLRVVEDNHTPLQSLLTTARGVSSLELCTIDVDSFATTVDSLAADTSNQLIDRFLKAGDYRIVAEPGDDAESITTEAEFDDEDDLVSEEIAEIYEKYKVFMKIRLDDRDKRRLFWALVCAALSGVLNGLFGAGGGIVLTFMYGRLCRGWGDAFASVVLTVMLMSIVSAWRYFADGAVDTELLSRLIVPAAVGGYLGAWISGRIKTEIIRIIFSVMLVISGINMAL